MNSSIYVGKIRHRRSHPKQHQFNFYAYMLLLDLDELTEVFGRDWLWRLVWSNRAPAAVRFKKDDHLKNYLDEPSLKQRARLALNDLGFTKPIGSIKLLTQLRHFGFEMNPVSFYYCSDASENHIAAVIAEVNNTPWGEQHLYLVTANNNDISKKRITCNRINKSFHVSPFMAMDMQYRMMFTYPDQKLGVKMENWQAGNRIFDVSMLLEKRPINGFNLVAMFCRFPLMSIQTFMGIYFQAFRLWLKKVPFHQHPRKSVPPMRRL